MSSNLEKIFALQAILNFFFKLQFFQKMGFNFKETEENTETHLKFLQFH